MNIIVVGVDGSPQALAAARGAAELVKGLGAELHIVTAVAKNQRHELGIGSDHTVVSDLDLAEEDLKAIADEFRNSVAVSTSAVRGSPADALCPEADRLHASMVVVGNKRVQGMARAGVSGGRRGQRCSLRRVHRAHVRMTPTREKFPAR